MSDHFKCLVLGQAGIGKTSFLKALPNARLLPDHAAVSNKETYLVEGDSSSSTGNKIEIQNIDISIETCLNETSEMYLNNNNAATVLPLLSSQIINTANVDVIVFCFALDDANSFHLIRSKWDIYLKKLAKSKKFILIGMKSDLASRDDKKKQADDVKVMYKKRRSCSVNSVSSTSRLQASKTKRILSESEQPAAAAVISNNACKKFAKTIRAKFIKLSNLETSNEHISSFMDELTRTLKVTSSTRTVGFKRTATFKSKLPKSISAPISTLVNRRSRKLIDVADEAKESPLIENISLKKKLSQLLTGLGTYVVTCGSKHKSRKLVNGQQPVAAKNSPLRNANKLLLKRKTNNKSWLLLGSDASLNSLTNEDEVFA